MIIWEMENLTNELLARIKMLFLSDLLRHRYDGTSELEETTCEIFRRRCRGRRCRMSRGSGGPTRWGSSGLRNDQTSRRCCRILVFLLLLRSRIIVRNSEQISTVRLVPFGPDVIVSILRIYSIRRSLRAAGQSKGT